jgi:hypothetical protein
MTEYARRFSLPPETEKGYEHSRAAGAQVAGMEHPQKYHSVGIAIHTVVQVNNSSRD